MQVPAGNPIHGEAHVTHAESNQSMDALAKPRDLQFTQHFWMVGIRQPNHEQRICKANGGNGGGVGTRYIWSSYNNVPSEYRLVPIRTKVTMYNRSPMNRVA